MNAYAKLTSAVALIWTAPAWAHPGAVHAGGAAAALAHPFTGLDHLIAMLVVGVWAGFARGHARCLPPLAFLTGMCAGAWLGATGFALAGVETGIALSLLALGPLAAAAARLPAAVAVVVCGGFGGWHGHAHGSELLADGGGVTVWAFLLGTAVLHGAGYAIARSARRPLAQGLIKSASIGTAAVGAYLLWAA